MESDSDFVGSQEIYGSRLERGATYGLSRTVYWRLASCALACADFGGIEPCTITKLADEEGCCLLLFGKRCLFLVTLRSSRNLLTLGVVPLDAADQTPCEVFNGSLSDDNDFGRVTNLILRTDGLCDGRRFLTLEEIEQWNNQQNETGWMMGGSI